MKKTAVRIFFCWSKTSTQAVSSHYFGR